jgi:AcrR family transcriptional regulator
VTTKAAPASGTGVQGEAGIRPSAGGGALDGGPRPLRADAVKNRARILEAAEEVFATQGVAVPVDVVAERAGVGVGTLYRHFPTKESLFEAIVYSRLEDLVGAARTLSTGADAADGLFSFLRLMATHASAKHDLFDALGSAGIDIKSNCSALIDEIKTDVEEMRRRAVDAGAIRADVSTDEMVGLVVGTCQVASHTGQGEVNLGRLVDVVCNGLRPATAT